MRDLKMDTFSLYGCSSDSRIRLICFPHAGGGASSFVRWCSFFPNSIDLIRVQLPGRENVADITPFTCMENAVNFLLPQILQIADRPIALYGHSMGALLAFEIARALHNIGKPPINLFVSGRRAPHRSSRHKFLHQLSDIALLDNLEKMAPNTASLRNSQLRRYALRVVRADLELCEKYNYRGADKLCCPISAFSSDADPFVSMDDILAWADETISYFEVRSFKGDHFFNHKHRSEIAEIITKTICEHLPD